MSLGRTAVAMILAILALGACARERGADLGPAGPSAPASTIMPEQADEDRVPGQPLASTISIVPISDALLDRAAAGEAIMRRLLHTAKPTIGTPYVWGGTELTKGIDCSNYIWLLYRSIGVPYERYIRTQELATMRRNPGFSQTTFAEARPGDLLVYGYREAAGAWHGHVVILVDKTGASTGRAGLVLGAHGSPVSAVQFVTFSGFAEGYFKTPQMRLQNVLRPVEPANAR